MLLASSIGALNGTSIKIHRTSSQIRNGVQQKHSTLDFTEAEFAANVTTIDSYFIDYSGTLPNNLLYGNIITRSPGTPEVQLGITTGNTLLSPRFQSYYNGVDAGTPTFWNLLISGNDLATYNVSFEGAWPFDLEGYIRTYFAANP